MNLMGKGMKSSCPWSCFCSCWLFHTMLTVYVSINTKTSPIKGLFFFFFLCQGYSSDSAA